MNFLLFSVNVCLTMALNVYMHVEFYALCPLSPRSGPMPWQPHIIDHSANHRLISLSGRPFRH